MPRSAPPQLPVWFERTFLALLIALKLATLALRWGSMVGADSGDLLFRVEHSSWAEPNPALKSSYWGYHPPLGFLWPASLMSTGIGAPKSVQCVATIAAIIMVVFLRQALKGIGFHRRPAGLCLLGVTASTPLIIHAATTMNIDIQVFAWGSVVLCSSLRVWWPPEGQGPRTRVAWAVLLVTALAMGMMTKFSMLLFFFVPVLVAWFGPGEWRARLRRVAVAVGLVVAAALIVLPYYHERYYKETGAFFPSANDWWYTDALREAKQARDADRGKWIREFLSPSPAAQRDGLTRHDLQAIHLSEAWRDFWIENDILEKPTLRAIRMGTLYWALAPWLMFGGLVVWLRRPDDPWKRLGWVILCFVLIQWGALASYIWTQPIAEFTPAKGIYVISTVLFHAFLFAQLAEADDGSRLRRITAWCALPALILFVFLNHLLPVY